MWSVQELYVCTLPESESEGYHADSPVRPLISEGRETAFPTLNLEGKNLSAVARQRRVLHGPQLSKELWCFFSLLP